MTVRNARWPLRGADTRVCSVETRLDASRRAAGVPWGAGTEVPRTGDKKRSPVPRKACSWRVSTAPESGFALLLVFAMASVMALALYFAMPRMAFESQRDKEEILVNRGHEYIRGIQLYVRKTKRFPGKMEDLENTNGMRFLRKQYVDPMTGKTEWRVIHAGPGGVLIDSLIKPLDKNKKEGDAYHNTLITEIPLTAPEQSDQAVNPALRRRPSDQPGPAAQGLPIPGDAPPGTLPAPDPNTVAGNPVTQPLPGAGPTAANTNMPGRLPTSPGGVYPGPAVNSQTGGVSSPQYTGTISTISLGGSPTQPPAPAPGQVPGQVINQVNNPNPNGNPNGSTPNSATTLIQNLLTQPRPGGAANLPQAQPGQQTIGGGIAGVATTFKGAGIKIYNDQDHYEKWEFVYDMSKDKNITGGATIPQPQQNQQGQQGQQNQQTPNAQPAQAAPTGAPPPPPPSTNPPQ